MKTYCKPCSENEEDVKEVYEDEEEVYDLDDYYPPKKKYKKKKKVPKEKPEPPLVKVTYDCQFCDAKLGDLHLIHDSPKYSIHFIKFWNFDQSTYFITLGIAIAYALFSGRTITMTFNEEIQTSNLCSHFPVLKSMVILITLMIVISIYDNFYRNCKLSKRR